MMAVLVLGGPSLEVGVAQENSHYSKEEQAQEQTAAATIRSLHALARTGAVRQGLW
jgi:hypothetical protein